MVRDLISILCCEVTPFVISRVGGCKVVPHVGQHIILGHAVSEFMQPSEVVLGTRVPLCGGFLVPLSRHGKILRNTFTDVIAQAEIVLGACMALLGQRSPFTQGGRIVCALIGVYTRLIIRPGGDSESDDQEQKRESESDAAVALKEAYVGCDGAVHREATVGTNRKGHGSLAGRRIVGRMRTTVQGPEDGEMVVFQLTPTSLRMPPKRRYNSSLMALSLSPLIHSLIDHMPL